ncbi:MAG: N-acetylmuramoyl-L-alanine amidase [Bacteroidales bacterium]|nr:N-acetylmuramoyl-L-alanine amidase [Bacteroidales bacterium]
MRAIDEIIVHCTATPEGRDISVEDITRWHIDRGFTTIGYHYVVLLDGTIERGRPEEQVGAHCKGHNSRSIGIAYVGGCDKAMRPKDTRTVRQCASLARLLKELKTKYPTATIHGHNEFANKACPSFDVQKWINEIWL